MYGFVFNFLKNEQVHFHKQTVINRNLSVGIHDGMGCVICSPLPAIQRIQHKFSQVVSVSSFFKFLTASNPHPLTIEGRASGKVSNAPSMPFPKNDKISDGGGGCKFAAPCNGFSKIPPILAAVYRQLTPQIWGISELPQKFGATNVVTFAQKRTISNIKNIRVQI